MGDGRKDPGYRGTVTWIGDGISMMFEGDLELDESIPDNWFPHGQGRMVWPNGNVYEGGWWKGKCHGHGRLERASTGEVFEGEFVGGMKHGKMVITMPGGAKLVGEWLNDKIVGPGSVTFPSGETDSCCEYYGFGADNVPAARHHKSTSKKKTQQARKQAEMPDTKIASKQQGPCCTRPLCGNQHSNMKKCARCKTAYNIVSYYCCRGCQELDWERHKRLHKLYKALLLAREDSNEEAKREAAGIMAGLCGPEDKDMWFQTEGSLKALVSVLVATGGTDVLACIKGLATDSPRMKEGLLDAGVGQPLYELISQEEGAKGPLWEHAISAFARLVMDIKAPGGQEPGAQVELELLTKMGMLSLTR